MLEGQEHGQCRPETLIDSLLELDSTQQKSASDGEIGK